MSNYFSTTTYRGSNSTQARSPPPIPKVALAIQVNQSI